MNETPSSRSASHLANRWSVSSAPSAAVGSSRISSRALQRKCLGDLHLLLRGDPQSADERIAATRRARGGRSCCLARRSISLRSTRPPRIELSADEDVLGDRQVGQQPHLLVDQADAGVEGVTRGGGCVRLAVPPHLAGVGGGSRAGDDARTASTSRPRSRRGGRRPHRVGPRGRRCAVPGWHRTAWRRRGRVEPGALRCVVVVMRCSC